MHQGTRSQAAAHTVPFLVRMALGPRLPDRHRFVGLLVAIAIGLDDNHLPNGHDPREDRASLADIRGEADDWARWIDEAHDVLTQVVARPPEKTETMPFLSGSYLSLAAMALAETPEATTLRAVDAMLAGLAGCKGVEAFDDRSYTAMTLFHLVLPDDPAEPPQSFGGLSDVQQRVVRFVADRDEDGRPAGRTGAFRRWKVPTKHSDLRVYAGIAQPGQWAGAPASTRGSTSVPGNGVRLGRHRNQ